MAHFDARTLLFIALGAFAIGYLAILVGGLRRPSRADESTGPKAAMPTLLATGFVTNFFDTLGIGSFATTTTIFRHFKLVRDEDIPGTLNVGHTLPTIVQAYIYTTIVPVDSRTLISMILAAVLGAWLGAGVVAGWQRRRIQIGMGVVLPVLAFAMLLSKSQLGSLPGGGTLLGLAGTRLAIAVTTNFVLGALMTIGLGLYAPCMILVSLLGMNPTTAFPIMMGSCAFLMPVGSLRFIRERSYSLRNALGLAIGGVPGVLVAAYIVKSLPLGVVRWLVIAVVLYTAITMLMTAARDKSSAAAALRA